MSDKRLTYVTSTLNKLPYLKVSLEHLIKNKKSDEEILVADGGSTDGTKQYLENLYRQGNIDGYLSEKDFGESHALNKLFLRAKGELITLITDDDAFDFTVINKCRTFMQENPKIDILGTNGAKKNQNTNSNIVLMDYANDYNTWVKINKPFMFCGLGIMFRTSSLPILGLWGIGFARADAEYTLRITSGKGVLAWYTGPSFVNISNPQSISRTQRQKIWYETKKLRYFYLNERNLYPKFLIDLRAKIRILRDKLIPKTNNGASEKWNFMFEKSLTWLTEQNKSSHYTFIVK